MLLTLRIVTTILALHLSQTDGLLLRVLNGDCSHVVCKFVVSQATTTYTEVVVTLGLYFSKFSSVAMPASRTTSVLPSPLSFGTLVLADKVSIMFGKESGSAVLVFYLSFRHIGVNTSSYNFFIQSTTLGRNTSGGCQDEHLRPNVDTFFLGHQY